MDKLKIDETKFDEWWEENYTNVSADRSEAFDIYSLGLKHQQAKVEELKASHHGEMIGHEVHFKKIKQERDELQTQLSLQRQRVKAFEDELTNSRNYGDELQKRVDKAIEAINEHYDSDGMSGLYFSDLKEILEGEQALKGEG